MATETVYIALLDENVNVWRPVTCEKLPDGTYRLPAEPPKDKAWGFEPGTRVQAEWRDLSGSRVRVAIHAAE